MWRIFHLKRSGGMMDFQKNELPGLERPQQYTDIWHL